MSNDDTTTDDDDQGNDGNLAHLREQASQTRQAREDADRLRRELMFVKAGIDTESKVGKMLFTTWQGDDLTALKAEAVDLGLIAAPAAPPPAELDASQQEFRAGLSGRPAGAVETPTPHPIDVAYEQFHRDMQAGVRDEIAREEAFGRVFLAATQGDKRVLFNEAAWQREAEAASRP